MSSSAQSGARSALAPRPATASAAVAAPESEPAVDLFLYPEVARRPGLTRAGEEPLDWSAETHEEGLRSAAAREGEERARAWFASELERERETLHQALEAFARQRQIYFRDVEREAVRLTLLIARKVLEREARVDPLAVAAMLHVAALTRIMAEFPRPVIMLSSRTREGTRITLDALERGAFDFIPKPCADSAFGIFDIRDELLAKIKSAVHSPLAQAKLPSRKAPARALPPLSAKMHTPPVIVAIGTSTGGPKALQDILSELPAQLPTGILIVQHMPVGFTAQFAERLNHACPMKVRESKGGETIEPGTVYLAPAGLHMTVSRTGSRYCTELSKLPVGTLHTPSVDVLLQSVASVFGDQAMGVILTGMGNDGAQGMKAIRDAGGWTVGQDAESCAVYGMPRSAAELDALCRVAPLSQIASEIIAAFPQRSKPAMAFAARRSPR